MAKKKLFNQIYPSYLFITVLSLIAIGWYTSQSVSEFYLNNTREDLRIRAVLLEKQVTFLLTKESKVRLGEICHELSNKTSTRITIILPSGEVLLDTERDAETMENHSTRPEIMQAMRGRTGSSIRYSVTLGQEMMYVAVPVVKDGKRIAVIRTSIPLSAIRKALNSIYQKFIWGIFIIAILAGATGWGVSLKITRPIQRLKVGAVNFARGDFSHRLPFDETDEINELAEAMNQMANQLQLRLVEITKQKNEAEAIFSSMLEGVLAVDADGKIIEINRAACELLKLEGACKGMVVQEMVRNSSLQDFLRKILENSDAVEEEFVFYENDICHLQVKGTNLKDDFDKNIGAVIVFNDITAIRKLEELRKEFVANVSHEIKTPLTAIKGSVETLLSGAINNPKDAKNFAEIILKHTNRLNAIIEDILSLSRIEREDETLEIELEEQPVLSVINAAVEICQEKAKSKSISLEILCRKSVRANINHSLMEQALVNLIDNAIKYSDTGSSVKISAEESENRVVLCVEDHGCGIAAENVPRLFERFYRVDKARSRKLGGTGLGLAIVKHIAKVHNGEVKAESLAGEGSRFKIILNV